MSFYEAYGWLKIFSFFFSFFYPGRGLHDESIRGLRWAQVVVVAFDRLNFFFEKKVLHTVALHSRCTGALTFENVRPALRSPGGQRFQFLNSPSFTQWLYIVNRHCPSTFTM
jgi:hypothetical protein